MLAAAVECPVTAPLPCQRSVLLAVTGLTPQTVTETLYALMREGADALPHEVHILTTAEGAERARLALLSEQPGWFHRLCADYGLAPIAFGPEHIHVLRDADGQALHDIRSAADNACAADQVAELVRRFTQDTQSQLHVSLAGGRKTLGFFAGYALSLWGRDGDRLTHVLVSEPFESTIAFYYPDEAQELDELFSRLNALAQSALNGHGPFQPRQQISLPTNLKRAEKLRDLLQRMVRVGGLVSWDGQRAVTFHDESAARYVGGGWVEEYTASKLRGFATCDCASPLEVKSMSGDDVDDRSSNELDAVMVHGNRMLVVECKAAVTRDDEKLADWIYKLNQVAHSVGGLMAQPLLLSAREITDKPRQRAREYGVDILAAGELSSLPDYLRRWMAG